MPKDLYCSACGEKLVNYPKAIPGKGYIVDLVDPHECEGYAVHENELGKPTILDIIESLKDIGKSIQDADRRSPKANLNIGAIEDKREDIVKSTAPQGLLQNIKNAQTSGATLDEIDEE